MYQTIEEARVALKTALADVLGDFGEEAVDNSWNDCVRTVAADCSPDVEQELLRLNGLASDDLRPRCPYCGSADTVKHTLNWVCNTCGKES